NVRLTLDMHLSDAQFDLIEGSYDLALRNAVLASSSLTARKLADDTRILCASPAYIEKYGAPNDPDDLKSHRIIAFRTLESQRLISSDGQQSELNPKQAAYQLILNDGMTQKLAALNGAGISVSSRWLIHEDITSGALRHVLPDYKIAEQPALWLIYPKSNVVSAKVRVFMDFLIEHVGKAPAWIDG
ncbi:MAG: substrate binding domain-containing protein, partial [Pseudomonadota bacterium]